MYQYGLKLFLEKKFIGIYVKSRIRLNVFNDYYLDQMILKK